MNHSIEYEELRRMILALEGRLRTVTIVGGTTIADNAVTNAKLADMAEATIKGRAAAAGTGDPQDLTANQVSTILDGASDPFMRTSAGGGGGSSVLLEQHTASSSASLDFTAAISATYDEYVVEFIQVVPATNGAKLYFRVSTDGGSTYVSSNSYAEGRLEWSVSGSTVGGSVTAHGQIQLISACNNGATDGICGHLRIFNPGGTSGYKYVRGSLLYQNGGPGHEGCEVMGLYGATTAVNAFRFLMDTGNISTGIIRVYGVAK